MGRRIPGRVAYNVVIPTSPFLEETEHSMHVEKCVAH